MVTKWFYRLKHRLEVSFIERSSTLGSTSIPGSLVSGKLKVRATVFGLCVLAGVVLFVPVSRSHADELNEPFSITNQNPFVRIFGLPRHRSSEVLSVGESESKIGYSVSSNYEFDERGSENFIAIDGETETFTLSYRRGLGNGWEAGIVLPLIKQSGGYLDRTIIKWHDWFGMPQGGRDQGPIDELNYRLDIGGINRFSLSERASGLGDVALFAGKSLSSGVNLRSEIKLPSGNEAGLLGSGGTDVGLSIDYTRDISSRWIWSAMVSFTHLSSGALGLDQERFVAALGSHLVYRVKPRLSLKLQWDLNSRPYKSMSLGPFAKPGGVLSFGGTVRLTDQDRIDLYFMENLPHNETAPDFGFKLEFARRIQE